MHAEGRKAAEAVFAALKTWIIMDRNLSRTSAIVDATSRYDFTDPAQTAISASLRPHVREIHTDWGEPPPRRHARCKIPSP